MSFLMNVGGIRRGKVCLDEGWGSHNGGVVCQRCVVGEGSVVSHRGSNLGVHGGSDFSDDRGSNLSNNNRGTFLLNNSVESVNGISGVFNNTTGSVRLGQRVRSLHGVSITSLRLFVVVSGCGIIDGIAVGVLGVGIEGFGFSGLGNNRGGNLGDDGCGVVYSWGSVVSNRGRVGSIRSKNSSLSDGHEGGEDNQLCIENT
jgi:hypothetical protein